MPKLPAVAGGKWRRGVRESMKKARFGPYLWVSWLTKILAGEQHCEWAVWFQAHFQGFDKVPDSGNLGVWTVEHTARVKERAKELTAEGYAVMIENQNKGTYKTKKGVTIQYKPDIVARKNGTGKVVDVKTGEPRNSDTVQVLLYMAMSRCPEGEVYYSRTKTAVPLNLEMITPSFVQNVEEALDRLSADAPAERVPSREECRFCKITSSDCVDRIEVETPKEKINA